MRAIFIAAVLTAVSVGTASAQHSGTFTDGRDGKTYRTAKVGKQVWMAQNLNYQAEGGSWCYGESADNCDKYGRLYDWNTARSVCPAGFHLPDTTEWWTLIANVGGVDIAGKKLKSKSGWYDYEKRSGNGTDNIGFSALPGGNRRSNGNFGSVGFHGEWWTATERSNADAFYRNIFYRGNYVHEDSDVKGRGASVRCVRDKD